MKELLIVFSLLSTLCLELLAQTVALQTSPDGRYLQAADGTPFYIVACTAWTLPSDYAADEVESYLDNRVKEGFNTIQMSAVFSEIDKQRYSEAFESDDILRPIPTYWEKVDYCIKSATDRGLMVIVNPLWKRSVNEFIERQGVERCREYGRWFARRYKDNPRVCYFIGGDQVPEPVREEMDAMGQGIQEVYRGQALVAYHSEGSQSSREAFPTAEWLTLNWTYAYTPAYKFEGKPRYPYQMNYENWQHYPDLPIQFGEGYYDFGLAKRYPEHGVTGRWGNRYVLRRQAWWNATSGAAGVAYGAEGIWHKNRDGEHWTKCIAYESSKDMGRMKQLLDCLEWWKLQPDMAHRVLTDGYGEYLTDNYATASVARDSSFALIYTPTAHALHIRIPRGAQHWVEKLTWFDPTNMATCAAEKVVCSGDTIIATPPGVNGEGKTDWVLLLGRNIDF